MSDILDMKSLETESCLLGDFEEPLPPILTIEIFAALLLPRRESHLHQTCIVSLLTKTRLASIGKETM